MKIAPKPWNLVAATLAAGLLCTGCSWRVPVQVVDAGSGGPIAGAQVTAISAKRKKGKFKRDISQAVTGLDGKAEMKLRKRMGYHRIQFDQEGYWTAGATVITWRTGEPEVLLVSPDDLSRVPQFLRIDDEIVKHDRLPPGIRQPDKTFHPGRTVVVPLYRLETLQPTPGANEWPAEEQFFEQDLP
ncbi:MAG: hypothetical protein ACO1QB_04950 [Verrucomicrobiales bacterium]